MYLKNLLQLCKKLVFLRVSRDCTDLRPDKTVSRNKYLHAYLEKVKFIGAWNKFLVVFICTKKCGENRRLRIHIVSFLKDKNIRKFQMNDRG